MSGNADSLSFSRLHRGLVFTAALCIVVASLRAVSEVLAPLLVSLFFSGLVLAPLRWLRKRGVGMGLSLAIVVVVAGGLITAVTFMAIHWKEVLTERWPDYRQHLSNAALSLAHGLERFGFHVTAESAREGIDTTMIRNVSGSMLRFVGNVAAVVVLTGFVFAEIVGLPQKVGPGLQGQPRLRGIVRNTVGRLLTYFRVKTATSLATGLLAGGACAAVGLELATLWGFLAFALNYITTVGSLVAAAPPLLLAAAMLGTTKFVILGLAYLAINMAIGAVLEPKLLGDSMGLSPLVVLLSLAFWGWVFGPIGVLLAAQITMLFKILFEQTEELRWVAVILGSRREGRKLWRGTHREGSVEQSTAVLERAAADSEEATVVPPSTDRRPA